jgi:hypothetical protein
MTSRPFFSHLLVALLLTVAAGAASAQATPDNGPYLGIGFGPSSSYKAYGGLATTSTIPWEVQINRNGGDDRRATFVGASAVARARLGESLIGFAKLGLYSGSWEKFNNGVKIDDGSSTRPGVGAGVEFQSGNSQLSFRLEIEGAGFTGSNMLTLSAQFRL